MKQIKIPSVVPIYLIAVVWVLYALVFPLYKWGHFIAPVVLALIVYFAASRLIPPRVETVPEEPIRTGNSQHDESLNEWRTFQRQLEGMERALQNRSLHPTVAELLSVSNEIFDTVSKEPDKLRLVRTFSSYYCPTLLSLLKRYVELSGRITPGPATAESKEKIETAVKDIAEAFRKARENLHQDEAMDTDVDIDVLDKMLRKEGLR